MIKKLKYIYYKNIKVKKNKKQKTSSFKNKKILSIYIKSNTVLNKFTQHSTKTPQNTANF